MGHTLSKALPPFNCQAIGEAVPIASMSNLPPTSFSFPVVILLAVTLTCEPVTSARTNSVSSQISPPASRSFCPHRVNNVSASRATLRTVGVCNTGACKSDGLLASKNLLKPSLYSLAIIVSTSSFVSKFRLIRL